MVTFQKVKVFFLVGMASAAAVFHVNIDQNKLTKLQTLPESVTLGLPPANADWYDFFKDVYDSGANVSVRGLFNQVWITEYDANALKKDYGSQASGVAYQSCRSEIAYQLNTWYISPAAAVIREEDGKFNCYHRVWGEKKK